MCGSCDYDDVAYARKLLGMLYRRQYDMKYEDKFSTMMIQLKADAKKNPTLRKIAIKLSRAPEWMDQLTGWDINECFIPKSIYEDEQQEYDAQHEEQQEQAQEEQQKEEQQQQEEPPAAFTAQ